MPIRSRRGYTASELQKKNYKGDCKHGSSWPSDDMIAEQTGKSRTTMCRYLETPKKEA
ncbi:MAG TPA: hypothetical protein VHA09_09745 [Nitrososphaera sp.]|nr:hypothetical protein [Nitrososphaera sp.]